MLNHVFDRFRGEHRQAAGDCPGNHRRLGDGGRANWLASAKVTSSMKKSVDTIQPNGKALGDCDRKDLEELEEFSRWLANREVRPPAVPPWEDSPPGVIAIFRHWQEMRQRS